MTVDLHLDLDYDNVDIRATAFAGQRGTIEPFIGVTTDPYITLTIAQRAPKGSNEIIFFIDSKDRADFAERIYNAIMALSNPEEAGGQNSENHD